MASKESSQAVAIPRSSSASSFKDALPSPSEDSSDRSLSRSFSAGKLNKLDDDPSKTDKERRSGAAEALQKANAVAADSIRIVENAFKSGMENAFRSARRRFQSESSDTEEDSSLKARSIGDEASSSSSKFSLPPLPIRVNLNEKFQSLIHRDKHKENVDPGSLSKRPSIDDGTPTTSQPPVIESKSSPEPFAHASAESSQAKESLPSSTLRSSADRTAPEGVIFEDLILPISLSELYKELFETTESGLFVDWHIKVRCNLDLNVSVWEGSAVGAQRSVSYKMPVSFPFVSQTHAACVERQVILAQSEREIIIESIGKSLEVPFGEHFAAHSYYYLFAESPSTTRLIISGVIKFSQNIMLKGRVEKTTISNAKYYFALLAEQLKQHYRASKSCDQDALLLDLPVTAVAWPPQPWYSGIKTTLTTWRNQVELYVRREPTAVAIFLSGCLVGACLQWWFSDSLSTTAFIRIMNERQETIISRLEAIEARLR